MRLILLHESPRSSVVYEAVQTELADIGSIAIDAPGYGLSDPPPGPGEIHDYAEANLSGLDALNVTRVVLAGVHTGASLAVAMAARALPGVVSGLALTGVSLMTAERRERFLADWARRRSQLTTMAAIWTGHGLASGQSREILRPLT